MTEVLKIAVLGAECTGKSELTLALHERLVMHSGLRAAAVGEWLREWCDRHQRTPRQHEQAAIAAEQQRRIAEASAAHDIVVCDTTALMTAVYSIWYFDDHSLLEAAVAAHEGIQLVLLTGLDMPWQADGLQRDGEHVRQAIDGLLRDLLARHGLAFTAIHGSGTQRLAAAWQAVSGLIERHSSPGRDFETTEVSSRPMIPAPGPGAA